ncbi:MAG: CPBP family intramembrane metalloprotease [Bacteroidetes bacterium]|jgi:membrane protease YdiL (CAAX protease family)|nr:CPBP family intramembrane metalloprotease [Bacteroidota bacterium]
MKRRLKKDQDSKRNVKLILTYLLITFGISWGVLSLYIFFPDAASSTFGMLSGSHPLFFLAVYAPAIASFIVIYHVGGGPAVKSFLSRFTLWRTSFFWVLFLVVGLPAIFYAGAALNGNLFNSPVPFHLSWAWIWILFLSMIKGPIEEFGWRGFMLPILQKSTTPLYASLLIGLVWGIWHLPAFLIGGTQQSSWAFLPFLIGTIAISIIMTALFNQSKGSILLAAILHFQLMNPIWPDAQPYDTWILLAVAFILVWTQKDLFILSDGVVDQVIPISGNTKTGEVVIAHS